MGGKQEVQAHKAHALPFPRVCPHPSPTDLPTRKKHDAVPPQLLNADPFAQIIGTETVSDVVIRVSRSYFILFFWQNPILSYFFGKCPILSYFLAILPLILVFCSLFITIISHQNIC